jgi:hypothetical protein
VTAGLKEGELLSAATPAPNLSTEHTSGQRPPPFRIVSTDGWKSAEPPGVVTDVSDYPREDRHVGRGRMTQSEALLDHDRHQLHHLQQTPTEDDSSSHRPLREPSPGWKLHRRNAWRLDNEEDSPPRKTETGCILHPRNAQKHEGCWACWGPLIPHRSSSRQLAAVDEGRAGVQRRLRRVGRLGEWRAGLAGTG